MPALPPAPNILRIDLDHAESAELALGNHFFMGYSGVAPSDSDLDTYAADIASLWNTHIAPMVVDSAALTAIVVTDLTSPTSGRGSWTGSHSGTRGAGELSQNACALINFKIGRRYRGGKPRIYAPWGIQSDLSNSQQWTSGFVTAANSAWNAFITSIGFTFGSGTSPTVQTNVSYYEGVELPITLPSGRVKQANKVRASTVLDTIIDVSTSDFVGTQRRRIRA